MNKVTSLSLIIFFLSISFLSAQEKPVVYKGATIYPITGDPIDRGVLIIENGLISAVGSESDITFPADATIHDVTGKVLMPGLVDTHSHVGGVSGGDRSSATHPEVRVLDSINPLSDTFMRARVGGITTINIMPGSGHLMSGQTVYVKNKPSNNIEEMLFCNDPLKDICGGMKMANGTNSIREAPFPGTRGKSAAIIRQLFVKAQEYKKKIDNAMGDPTKMPERDLQMEALVEVLEGKRIVQHHTHRADDILTVLRLSDEFGFKVVLHHVSEGQYVAKEIAEANAPCSIILIDSPGGKLEAVNLLFDNAAKLADAGVEIAFHTDDFITDSRLFLRSAAFGVRAGLSREKALEALTIAGAKMLGLEEHVGSLEAGKDADFIILDGDPLSTYTKVEKTFVDGKIVFDRSDPEHYNYAVGGYNVYRNTSHNHLCEGVISWE
jgi:imidazolonepropionase-like amidohydrolase